MAEPRPEKAKKRIKIEETIEEQEQQMAEGAKDEEVYREAGREKLKEDDELEDWEEGFMEGAEGRGEQNCCAECGKLLGEDRSNIFEREFDREIKWFCSEQHAENYSKKVKKTKKHQEIL
jgi:hypothetical protein